MVYTRPKTVTRPSSNRARRALTSFMQRTPLTTTPRDAANQGVVWTVEDVNVNVNLYSA